MSRIMMLIGLFLLAGGCLAARLAAQDETRTLTLQKGDRICLIGNTLAERMQHDGWFETWLQSRFPDLELSLRNLGFSGDELTVRLRSAGFGSPDEHLQHSQADVVFAFFGYNESFGGADALGKFKQDLAEFIRHTCSQEYNGRSTPRLVLFSPIAHENLYDRNLPDGSENNQRLELYTDAMAEVAGRHEVVFVDLFRSTRPLYADRDARSTRNGVHLNSAGNRELAELIGATPADQSVRRRKAVSRTGQPRADGVRPRRPPVGGRNAVLPALEAQGPAERQGAHPGGY